MYQTALQKHLEQISQYKDGRMKQYPKHGHHQESNVGSNRKQEWKMIINRIP